MPNSPDVLGHPALLREQGEAPEVAHSSFWQGREDATQPRARPPSAQVCPCQAFIFTLLGRRFSHLKKNLKPCPIRKCAGVTSQHLGKKCLKIKVINPKKYINPDVSLGIN